MDAKKLFSITALSLLSLNFVACSKSETYTVDFLLANDDVREQVLADCATNKQTDQNCKNANEAKNQKAVEELRNRMRN